MTEKPPYPSQLQDRFIVRMPDGMRDRIAEAAKAAGRSMNAEIVHRLEESFVDRASWDNAYADGFRSAFMETMRDAQAAYSLLAIWEGERETRLPAELRFPSTGTTTLDALEKSGLLSPSAYRAPKKP